MRGRQSYVPGVGLVTYVPGGRVYHSRVLATDPAPSEWDRRGVLAVAAVLAGCLIADGAALWLAAWIFL